MAIVCVVVVEKMERLFFCPIGTTSRKATNGGSPGLVGNMTASLGMALMLRLMR